MTGSRLLTRTEFFTQLKQTSETYHNTQQEFAVLLIGINRFKKINLLYGFEIGDQILDKITERIIEILPEGNVIAKTNNSGFAILLKKINHIGQVILATNKICSLLNEPFIVSQHAIRIKTCIGISSAHPSVGRFDDYIHQAEAALELAKESNAEYMVYSEALDFNLNQQIDIEGKINIALEEGEFELYYQPKIDLQSGSPIGAEALIRWNNPVLGQISPSTFIPIAEQTGQIIPITFWTLNTALRQLNEWPEFDVILNVAVNFSAIATKDEDLVERIQSALKIWGIDYPRLTIEITESTLLSDPTKTFEILKKLKNLGIKISIDDFGTGYSSLSYFKNIPATELKIDQSFVSKVLSSPTDLQITKTIIAIAKEFELKVVAEGIEDQATYDALLTLGCDIGQGYFIGRPMPLEKFVAWLKSNRESSTKYSNSNQLNPPHKPSQRT